MVGVYLLILILVWRAHRRRNPYALAKKFLRRFQCPPNFSRGERIVNVDDWQRRYDEYCK